MGSFSIWHWVVVLLVIVLLFGAKKIPEVAKGLGSGIKDFKKALKEDEEDSEDSSKAAIAQKTTKESPVKKTRATTTKKASKTTTKKTKDA